MYIFKRHIHTAKFVKSKLQEAIKHVDSGGSMCKQNFYYCLGVYESRILGICIYRNMISAELQVDKLVTELGASSKWNMDW